MKKKLFFSMTIGFVLAIGGLICINVGEEYKNIIFDSNVEALATNESTRPKYQDMGYCKPFQLKWMCVTTKTSTRCSIDCP